MNERDKAALMVAVEDAKDTSAGEMQTISDTHQPTVDALNDQAQTKHREAEAKRQEAETADDPEPLREEADTLDADADALAEQAQSAKDDIRRMRDLTRQLRLVEAVQAQGQTAAMFEDFEIRARHDLPGSQYVARTLTEACQAEGVMDDLLAQRVTAIKSEIDTLTDSLDGMSQG